MFQSPRSTLDVLQGTILLPLFYDAYPSNMVNFNKSLAEYAYLYCPFCNDTFRPKTSSPPNHYTTVSASEQEPVSTVYSPPLDFTDLPLLDVAVTQDCILIFPII